MRKKSKEFQVLYPNAAGIDISSKEHYVAVSPEVDEIPIRAFGSFTEDLKNIVKWLKECDVDTVAMEATGIYWVSLFLMLEESGFKVFLVNAKHVKNVTGKKTDESDAEWIRRLHSCGLLSASFQPDDFTRTLRTYMRHRKNYIEMGATHIRMMHKAMEQMNIKLQHVITDITGKSGQDIIKAILKGERNAEVLAALCDRRVKASKKDDIIKSLNATWKEEHLFELEQNYSTYHFYQTKIYECDKKIEEHLKRKSNVDNINTNLTKTKANKNNLNFRADDILKNIVATDITAICGITTTNAIELISEVGTDMSKWRTSKHFTSWLNLAPNTKISGGKILSSKIPKKKNLAGQIFKMAAFAIQRSKNWLAAFYNKIKVRKGTSKAVVATARKIATIFYKMMKDKTAFQPFSNEEYDKQNQMRNLNRLKRQAQNFGFQLVKV
jgi:transposase